MPSLYVIQTPPLVNSAILLVNKATPIKEALLSTASLINIKLFRYKKSYGVAVVILKLNLTISLSDKFLL